MRKICILLLCFSFSLVDSVQAQTDNTAEADPMDNLSDVQNQQLPGHPLVNLRHLDSGFPFEVPDSLDSWNQRRDRLKQDLMVSLGLWPMPPKTPLNAVIHGSISMDGYTVSKVYFQSMPGFFVTGNLYRPLIDDSASSTEDHSRIKQFPGVLCPHGHFREGRFTEATHDEIETELASGAESLASNAKSILQSRCAHLAKMGCVVFHYDMIGYADSQQIPYAVAHGFVQRRKQMEQKDHWGFFSPQAELRLQSIMGLQTWNSIRALDFLISLPEVDPQRLGVTGASGGGTQTFILGAIDDRPTVAFPAVMVSTEMQGGCTCENTSLLRVSAGNVDFAAMFAPRPMGLTAADDWTRNFQSDGFPQLQAVYDLYGQPKNVHLTARLEFGHNFNSVGRRAMYAWFHQHLSLDEPLEDEHSIQFLPRDQLTVYDQDHPAPPGGETFEAILLRRWDATASQQLGFVQVDGLEDSANVDNQLQTEEEKENSLSELLLMLSKGWQSIIGHPQGRLSWKKIKTAEHQNGSTKIWIESSGHRLTTPLTIISGNAFNPKKVLLAVSLSDFHQLEKQHWQPWLDQDWTILIPHLLYSGDLTDPQNPDGENRLAPNGRYAAGYTFGYNRSVLAWRASQVIDVCHLLIEEATCLSEPVQELTIVGARGLEGLVLMAASQVMLDQSSLEKNADSIAAKGMIKMAFFGLDFRFDSVGNLEDAMFLPGSVRYGDLGGLLRLTGDYPILLVQNESDGNRTQAESWASGDDSKIQQISVKSEEDGWTKILDWRN